MKKILLTMLLAFSFNSFAQSHRLYMTCSSEVVDTRDGHKQYEGRLYYVEKSGREHLELEILYTNGGSYYRQIEKPTVVPSRQSNVVELFNTANRQVKLTYRDIAGPTRSGLMGVNDGNTFNGHIKVECHFPN